MSTPGTIEALLVEAAERYLLRREEAAISALDRVKFLSWLAASLDRLAPERVRVAGEGLLELARTLAGAGDPGGAKALADTVTRAGRRAVVRAGGTATLAAKSEEAGLRFSAFLTVEQPRVTAAPVTLPQPPARQSKLEEKWAQMSDERRDRLAALAERFL